MKAGRIVVVSQDSKLMIGLVTNIVFDKEVPGLTGPGVEVQFVKDGPATFYSKASGAVHKIRDEKIEKFAQDELGWIPPVSLAQVDAFNSEDFGHGEPEEETEEGEDEDHEGEDEEDDSF